MASSTDLVLVTGASGFIATHIVQQLLEAGYRVRGTVRSTKNEEKMKPLYQLCPEANDRLEFVDADLLDEKCWPEAVKDCTYVIHTASPLPLDPPKHEDELIKPAVEGTISVLRAAQEAGTVNRVVLTSSTEAVYHCDAVEGEKPLTEENWSDVKHHTMYPYAKSKTLAERAAWDFIDGIPEEKKIELVVINPSFTAGGPILCPGNPAGITVIQMMLNKEIQFLPNVGFGVVDVRDVAKAHLNAMKLPEAAGHRHIITSSFMWLKDMAAVIEKEFKPQGYNIPTTVLWNFLVKISTLFYESAKNFAPMLDIKKIYDNTRMKNVLGITPRSAEEAVLETCYSLIETERVRKTSMYRGREKSGEVKETDDK